MVARPIPVKWHSGGTRPARRSPGREDADTSVAEAARSFLVPLMSPRDKLVFGALACLWIAALAQFWIWWLQPGHNIGLERFILNTVLVAWTTLVPGYFLGMLFRARVPNPNLALPPNWRVAMVVTKAPSEPAQVVRKTLLAMLAQHYPHDTWLADEDPTPEMIDWCNRHGIRISTRRDVPRYHRTTWPRRTRCKEGNLAWFYDTFGYENYDFVVQLDADHVPSQGYLEAMLRPFLDRSVGYVSAPSQCDSNAAKSWSARGRLHVEALLHGALQSGYTGGFAPLCIGSHYAVRTTALREIGGLGPELAEDHSTTLLMNAGGWRGVHAIDAEAHGEGPNTFPDMVVQEFQWSRSLVAILLRYTPQLIGGLSLRMRLQFLFCQLWYGLFSVSMAATVVLPVVALTSGKAWVGVSYVDFIMRFAVLVFVLLLTLFWLRRRGWLRPYTCVLSWESFAFIFARWPWTLMGAAVAVVDFVRGRTSGFRVTPKGEGAIAPLPFRVLAPYFAISLTSGLTALLVGDPGSARGFYVFAVANCLIYLALAALIMLMHPAGSQEGTERKARAWFRPLVLRPVAMGGAVAVLLVSATLRLPAGVEGMLWGSGLTLGSDRSISEMVRGPDTVQLGVYDWNDTFGDEDYVAIEHEFVSWLDDLSGPLAELARHARQRDRWPMVTVEPWSDGREGSSTLLGAVNGGLYDQEIARSCKALSAMGVPIFVRWGHEMETPTGRYPWADFDSGAYVKAYQRFVEICRRHGKEFYYVWSPRGDDGLHRYYPGLEYVDIIGLSLYSYAAYELDYFGRIRSFAENLSERYDRVRDYKKTVMIAELGVDGTMEYRRQWLADGLAQLHGFPLVHSIVYFNAPDSPEAWGEDWPKPDWSIDPRVFTAGPNQLRIESARGD